MVDNISSKLVIGGVELTSNAVLAPMAGVSDVGFRYLCKKYGAGLTYTEMISVKALEMHNKRTFELLTTAPNEAPCAVQLFGSDPQAFYNACILKELRKFDIIDINMGCPVRKVVSRGEGSALMRTPDLAAQIVKACIEGSGKPVTIKQRLGFDSDIAVEFAGAMEKAGVSAITVHGRTREDFYRGVADRDAIKRVVSSVSIPVIANGDVKDADDAKAMIDYTGADGVMIGRSAMGNPWIFAEYLGNHPEIDVLADAKEHIDLLLTFCTERAVTGLMKAHLMGYVKGKNGARDARVAIGQAQTIDNVYDIIRNYFLSK